MNSETKYCKVAVVHHAIRMGLKKFVLVLLSRPSTGKGKLADFLGTVGFTTVSCSGALTEMAESDPSNPEMQEILSNLAKGVFAKDSSVFKAMDRKLALVGKHSPMVLDGFPRKLPQVSILGNIIVERQIPSMVLELFCTREEANNRRIARIHEAHKDGNPPRAADISVERWNDRQDEYEANYDELVGSLKAQVDCYKLLDTTDRQKAENHARAFNEILRFAYSF
jgi:adenylate kinase family enzyme